MRLDCQPIVCAAPIKCGDTIKFLRYNDSATINGDIADDVWKVLAKCNGQNSAEQIVTSCGLKKDRALCVMQDLFKLEVLCDSRELYRVFNRISGSPTNFYNSLSDAEIRGMSDEVWQPIKKGASFDTIETNRNGSSLQRLLKERHSTRRYSDKKISRDQVIGLCQFGYGTSLKPVPSGGGLYPIHIFVIVLREQEGLPKGYYEYDSVRDSLTRFSDIDERLINYAFDAEDGIFGSSVQLMICANVDRQARKYANKAYRLSLIEAGQVAQSISLAATEAGLATCELGGVLDDIVTMELELPMGVIPILGMAVGYEDNKPESGGLKIAAVDMVGSCHSTVYCGASQHCATYTRDNGRVVAGATATSSAVAMYKARVEGYERYIAMNPRIDFVCSAGELDCEWVDPREVVPLDKFQLRACGLEPFNETIEVAWTKAKRLSTSVDVAVPSAMVYYGCDLPGARVSWANSSGVAAFADCEGAIASATFELVERDTIMRTWLSRQSPKMIGRNLLDIHNRRRINYWLVNGRQVEFLLLPSEYAYVVLATITSDRPPYFVCGASASDSLELAVDKAYSEAEYALCAKLNIVLKPIDEAGVRSPSDHGMYYAATNRNCSLNWLWRGSIVRTLSDLDEVARCDNMLNAIDPVIVDMGKNASGIHVVRAISSKLVPINFGYRLDYYTHKNVCKLSSLSVKQYPHFFA